MRQTAWPIRTISWPVLTRSDLGSVKIEMTRKKIYLRITDINPYLIMAVVLITTSVLLIGCGPTVNQPNPDISEGSNNVNSNPSDLDKEQIEPEKTQAPSPNTSSESGADAGNPVEDKDQIEPEETQEAVDASSPDANSESGADSKPVEDKEQIEPGETPEAVNPSPDTGSENAAEADGNPADLNGNQIKRETRALWWRGDQTATSKSDVDKLLAQIDSAHLNVLLFRVYANGTAFFEPSQTRFPDSNERLTNQSSFAEAGYRDALSYLLAIRDERRSDNDPFNDFEIHPWFTVSKGGHNNSKEWPHIDKTEPYMLNAIFPEFRLKYGYYYLKEDERYIKYETSVIHQPKFRAYMVDLIAGLVEDYEVDGVHLDYIRTGGVCFNNEPLDYPGTEYDYSGCQEDYKAWSRDTYGREYTLWEDTDGRRNKNVRDGESGRVAAWQRRTVGMLVKDIHHEVKSVNPDLIISVASVINNPEARKTSIQGQVAWEWLDQGWIDAAFVTAYYADTQRVVGRLQQVREAAQHEGSRSKIFPGLITFELGNRKNLWSDLVVEQVKAVMYGQWQWAGGQALMPPTKGVALFRAELSGEAIRALADGPFKEPALPFWGE